MMKDNLVRSALACVKRAEDLIVSEMAANGIPDPAVIIHADMQVTLYSRDLVFACGIRRLRRRRQVRVAYGNQVEAAIAAAEIFIRRRRIQ